MIFFAFSCMLMCFSIIMRDYPFSKLVLILMHSVPQYLCDLTNLTPRRYNRILRTYINQKIKRKHLGTYGRSIVKETWYIIKGSLTNTTPLREEFIREAHLLWKKWGLHRITEWKLSSPGGGTSWYGLHRYVLPRWVWLFSLFSPKLGIGVGQFGNVEYGFCTLVLNCGYVL